MDNIADEQVKNTVESYVTSISVNKRESASAKRPKLT